MSRSLLLRCFSIGALALAAGLIWFAGIGRSFAQTDTPAIAIPAAAYNPPDNAPEETAILSGGCFWAMQGVFEHVRGVEHAYAGYTGGAASTATYDQVSTGSTGHAETVKIIFNPAQISYAQILQIYFSVATDPTQLNYQGPDDGTQYRGEIWYESPQQEKIAQAYIAQLSASHVYPAPIVTRLDPAMPFYVAENYHQDFLVRNPDYPYIAINDIPKVQALAHLFPTLYRADPVTVFPVS